VDRRIPKALSTDGLDCSLRMMRRRVVMREKSTQLVLGMRKVDGWHMLATKPIDQPIDVAA
jgi:hypothetical protein